MKIKSKLLRVYCEKTVFLICINDLSTTAYLTKYFEKPALKTDFSPGHVSNCNNYARINITFQDLTASISYII